MKTIIFLLLAIIVVSMHSKITTACDCIETPTVSKMLQNNDIDYVYRGYVKTQLNITSTNRFTPKYYTVRVWRVFKGCTFTNATTIVIKTASDSSLCGVYLETKKNYIFSGRDIDVERDVMNVAKKANPKVLSNVMVSIQLCDLNREFKQLSSSEKTQLRMHKQKC